MQKQAKKQGASITIYSDFEKELTTLYYNIGVDLGDQYGALKRNEKC